MLRGPAISPTVVEIGADPASSGGDLADPSVSAPARRAVRRRRRMLPRSLTVWFLIIGVPIGTFLVFAIPAFQGLDEPNHFLRVFTITDGAVVVPHTHSYQRSVEVNGMRASVAPGLIYRGLTSQGVVVSGCVAKYISHNLDDAARLGPMNPATSFHTPRGCGAVANTFERIDNTAVDSPAAYAPQVVAVALLRLFGAPLPLIFYGGRLFGLAVFLALAALAIRVAPRGKGFLFVVPLLPISLQSAATYNADALLLAASLLVVALTIRCCADEQAGWGTFAALAAAVWLVALCKEPYGLIALLVLLVPAGHLAARPLRGRTLGPRSVTLIKVGVVAVTGALIVTWWALGVRGNSLAAQYAPHYVNQHVQTWTLLHRPFAVLSTIWHTLVNTGAQQYTMNGGFLELGFFRNQSGGSLAPVLVVVVGVIALFVSYQCELAGGRFSGRWSSGSAVLRTAWLWLPVVIVAVAFGLIYVESFVRDTPPGARLVDPLAGIPGRYFLPLAGLPMVSVVMAKGTGARRVPNGWLVAAAVAMSIFLVIKVFTRFW